MCVGDQPGEPVERRYDRFRSVEVEDYSTGRRFVRQARRLDLGRYRIAEPLGSVECL